MTNTTYSHFRSELNSFFALIVLNLVFGALAMAFGIQFIVGSVFGQTGPLGIPVVRVFAGAVAMVSFGLGLAWVISSAEILEGIEGIFSEFWYRNEPIPGEILTCGIVGMVSQYREHKDTIQRMILVCTLGGCCFLILGIVNSLEFLSVSLSGGAFTLNNYLLIPAALVTLGIALVSLLSSYYFGKFAKAWDLRLAETVRSENLLERTFGMGKE